MKNGVSLVQIILLQYFRDLTEATEILLRMHQFVDTVGIPVSLCTPAVQQKWLHGVTYIKTLSVVFSFVTQFGIMLR